MECVKSREGGMRAVFFDIYPVILGREVGSFNIPCNRSMQMTRETIALLETFGIYPVILGREFQCHMCFA